jgi:hypothetical protein
VLSSAGVQNDRAVTLAEYAVAKPHAASKRTFVVPNSPLDDGLVVSDTVSHDGDGLERLSGRHARDLEAPSARMHIGDELEDYRSERIRERRHVIGGARPDGDRYDHRGAEAS